MSASPVVQASAVTPAKVRRRAREQALRGPAAHPQRLDGPGGRPQQPLGPVMSSGPVALQAPVRRTAAARRPVTGGVQLSERGLLVVISLLALIAVAAVGIGLKAFLGVSNAPLGAQDAPVVPAAGPALVVGG